MEHETFDLRGTLLRRAPRIRAIQEQTKCRIIKRGKGSDHKEASTGREMPTALMLFIGTEGHNLNGFIQCVKQVSDLLSRTKQEYLRHCELNDSIPATPAFTIGPLPGSQWEDCLDIVKDELPPRHTHQTFLGQEERHVEKEPAQPEPILQPKVGHKKKTKGRGR